jgi:hypothetical protein
MIFEHHGLGAGQIFSKLTPVKALQRVLSHGSWSIGKARIDSAEIGLAAICTSCAGTAGGRHRARIGTEAIPLATLPTTLQDEKGLS